MPFPFSNPLAYFQLSASSEPLDDADNLLLFRLLSPLVKSSLPGCLLPFCLLFRIVPFSPILPLKCQVSGLSLVSLLLILVILYCVRLGTPFSKQLFCNTPFTTLKLNNLHIHVYAYLYTCIIKNIVM